MSRLHFRKGARQPMELSELARREVSESTRRKAASAIIITSVAVVECKHNGEQMPLIANSWMPYQQQHTRREGSRSCCRYVICNAIRVVIDQGGSAGAALPISLPPTAIPTVPSFGEDHKTSWLWDRGPSNPCDLCSSSYRTDSFGSQSLRPRSMLLQDHTVLSL
jgi:hypothetical protein